MPSHSKRETVRSTPESLRDRLLDALSLHFGESFGGFQSICQRWAGEEWKEIRLNVQSRLSKISYMAPTLAFESFAAVEKEVLLEWRKNRLLKGLAYLWAHSFRVLPLPTLAEAKAFY